MVNADFDYRPANRDSKLVEGDVTDISDSVSAYNMIGSSSNNVSFFADRSKARELLLFELDRPSLNADDTRGTAVRHEDHYSD